MSDALKLSDGYLPKTYRGRVNWYVSTFYHHDPIHLFRTKQDAIKWAKSQPPQIVGDVNMTASLDWFPAGSDPRKTVSSSKQFIDHRISKETSK